MDVLAAITFQHTRRQLIWQDGEDEAAAEGLFLAAVLMGVVQTMWMNDAAFVMQVLCGCAL